LESEDVINEFNEKLKELDSKVDCYLSDCKKTEIEVKYLKDKLDSIAFLFKNSEYQHERELRLVINGNSFHKKNYDADGIIPKVYIELIPFNTIIEKIVLGPKVQRAEEWRALFHYKMLEYGVVNPEICISTLPYK
jgi:hypothetical protein